MANIYVSSGTSFSATISITYPAGSTCTVSNYKKTWTAPNTSGSWTFKANEVGYYTVKAVSEDKSKEEEILITAEGQAETVELSYSTDFVIYSEEEAAWKNGYSLINLLTGDILGANPDATPPYIGLDDDYQIAAITNKAFDVTGYTTLKITGSLTGNSTQWPTAVGLIKESNTYDLTYWSDNPGTGGMVAYFTDHNFTKKTKTIDIKSLSGEHRLKWNWYASDLPSHFTIYDIRLVK